MTQKQLLQKALLALNAQQTVSDIQKQGWDYNPADPRFTPLIGEWNGYQAPEQRLGEYIDKRGELRDQVLEVAAKKGLL